MVKYLAQVLFWGSASLVLYVYVGFPLILALRGLLRPRSVRRDPAYTPKISFIIVAHNEAAVVTQKLDNVFALDYPRECLEVVFASDGSDDGTDELVADYGAPEVKLLSLPRQGKNRSLNAAVSAARGDILVFSDADSMLARDALRHLIAPFKDVRVGGVGGDYRYPTTVANGQRERTYWNLDRMLKKLQDQSGNMTSTTGQIYAIRRSLFKPVPPHVTDDFFTSVQVPAAHYWLVFEPRAIAYGPIADSVRGEFRRKVRIMTRGLSGVWESRRLLNPFEYGFYAIQLLTHKVLRRLIVIPLLALAVTAPILWQHSWLYRLATVGQLGLHGAATLGFLLRGTRIGQQKILSLPFYFDLVYVAAGMALANLLSGKRFETWGAERST